MSRRRNEPLRHESVADKLREIRPDRSNKYGGPEVVAWALDRIARGDWSVQVIVDTCVQRASIHDEESAVAWWDLVDSAIKDESVGSFLSVDGTVSGSIHDYLKECRVCRTYEEAVAAADILSRIPDSLKDGMYFIKDGVVEKRWSGVSAKATLHKLKKRLLHAMLNAWVRLEDESEAAVFRNSVLRIAVWSEFDCGLAREVFRNLVGRASVEKRLQAYVCMRSPSIWRSLSGGRDVIQRYIRISFVNQMRRDDHVVAAALIGMILTLNEEQLSSLVEPVVDLYLGDQEIVI